MFGEMIYLDHAAATPVDSRVVTAMLPYFSDIFFNPSSPYAPAVEVRHAYNQAKADLAATFGAKADEVVMTAGATESINLAFASCSGHAVTSSIEHPAVLAAAKQKDHTLITPTPHGLITPEEVAAAIRDDTQLVSIQLANNEIGTIQPIRAIAEVIEKIQFERKEKGNTTPLYMHVDASQGFGYIDIHTARLGADMITLNSGKMYGPKQVGLLWVRSGVTVLPLIVGGGQERGLRSGTENVAGVIGFAKAAQLAAAHRTAESKRIMTLRDMLAARLTKAFPDALVLGHPKKRLPNILHIAFPGLDAERLIFMLEAEGVMVATGSACAANKGTRSHVLTALSVDPSAADGSLRLSLGQLNTNEAHMQRAADLIIAAVEKEQKRVRRHE